MIDWMSRGFLWIGYLLSTVSTLVVCLDRRGDLPTSTDPPVVGFESVEELITSYGIEDPEDSRVNCFLEGLRVARDLEAEGEDVTVAVISDSSESIGVDRSVARQIEKILEEHDPDSAIVVTDSTEDERLVPIIESRIPVDAVDRVVVRQARDIESTYYLLKQFLADEELRETVLVPIGAALLALPLLLLIIDNLTMALGGIAAAVGLLLIYKGLGIDEYLATLSHQVHEALYSGRVSLVTYVVAVGLALIGLFVGALDMSPSGGRSRLIMAMAFGFESILWLTAGGLAASTGRLLDELIRQERVGATYLNLPFGVVSVGLVVRGITGYFLERSGELESMQVSTVDIGLITVEGFTISASARLAIYVMAGIFISLIGVWFASHFGKAKDETTSAQSA